MNSIGMSLNNRGSKRRVVITGSGPVCCIGIGKEAFWTALVSGKSGIAKITSFDASSFPNQIGGEVNDFEPADFMSEKSIKTTGRFTHFAVAAARLAFEDSKLQLCNDNSCRIGVCTGSSTIGLGDIGTTQHKRFLAKGYRAINPWSSPEFTTHTATTHICSELGIKGPNTTISSGCSTAFDAVSWGYDQILRGNADAIIAGGADAPFFPFTFACICAARVLSRRNEEPQKASRPYDKLRDGIVLSEGGAAVVLEELKHALDRRATIYAELVGYGSSAEGGGNSEIDKSGEAISRAMLQAINQANLSVGDIDYIHAHGCSLPDYDVSETNAIKSVFGKRACLIPVSSIKSMIGQSLAPASGFQLISSCISLQKQIIPPTINYEYPDPDCDLDYVPNKARFNRIDNVLMNSHSVGETHSVIIIAKYCDERLIE